MDSLDRLKELAHKNISSTKDGDNITIYIHLLGATFCLYTEPTKDKRGLHFSKTIELPCSMEELDRIIEDMYFEILDVIKDSLHSF
jgi:hypothetical protein